MFDIVPTLQSVGISSCIPLCCLSISSSVDLCSSSHKVLVLEISRRFSRIKQWPNHLRLLFSRKVSTGLMCSSFLMSSFNDVLDPGLPSCPPHHPHFDRIYFLSFYIVRPNIQNHVVAGLMIVYNTLFCQFHGHHITPDTSFPFVH